MSVFAYFFAALFGRQYLYPRDGINDLVSFPNISSEFSTKEPFSRHTPDMYIPCFTILEFISYFGWIKVAESLLNPFGDDDEDFQINYLIDRNFQVSCEISHHVHIKSMKKTSTKIDMIGFHLRSQIRRLHRFYMYLKLSMLFEIFKE